MKHRNPLLALFLLLSLACSKPIVAGDHAIEELTLALDSYRDGMGEYPAEAVWIREEQNGSYRMRRIDCSDALFVLDTSGSMRDPSNFQVKNDVIRRMEVFIQAMPDITRIRVLDYDGTLIAKASKTKKEGTEPLSTKELTPFLEQIKSYSNHSSSNFETGLLAALKLKDPKRDTRIFVFGDELPINYKILAKLLKQADTLVEKKRIKIDFIKISDFKATAERPFESSSPAASILTLTSTIKFNHLTGFLAQRWGGKLYVFDPLIKEPNIAKLEWLPVLELARKRPNETWALHSDPSEIEKLNTYLEFNNATTRLVPSPSATPEFKTLSFKSELIDSQKAWLHMSLQAPELDDLYEYRALVCWEKPDWKVTELLTILEPVEYKTQPNQSP